MTYNQTLLNNVSDIGTAASFININSGGMFFVMFIVTLIIIISIYGIRNNMREFKAIFFAFSVSLIPTVLLALIDNFGGSLIPPWFVVLHITLFAATGVFAYLTK